MKFTQYPRKGDRQRRENGEEREGAVWSAAPGGVWIRQAERRDGEPTALLGHKSPDGSFYVITAEN